jgi:hypothetical protein
MAELCYAGVDVAKDTVELALGPKASVESFANEPSGHEAIVKRLLEAMSSLWPARRKRQAWRWR